MDRSNEIKLIKQIYRQDDILQWVATEEERIVFCDVRSITQTEWFEAGRNGIQPAFIFTINRYEYDNERIVEFEGKRYSVYRTYIGRNEQLELHCEEKGGVQNGEANQSGGTGAGTG